MEKISWYSHEYIYKEKTSDWYWIVGIVTVSIAIIAIILANFIFAILIIISSFTLSLFAARKPELIEVSIDNLGVNVGKTRYSYREIESFWIEVEDNHPRILLKSHRFFMPFIVILIGKEDYQMIHEALSKKLKEVHHTEPLLEKLLIYLGF